MYLMVMISIMMMVLVLVERTTCLMASSIVVYLVFDLVDASEAEHVGNLMLWCAEGECSSASSDDGVLAVFTDR